MGITWTNYSNNSSAIAKLYPSRANEEETGGVLPFDYESVILPSADYSSFSGSDIVCTMQVPGVTSPVTFGNLRTVSYSIMRDKRPVRILGTINPIGWCMSNRIVAGTLIFTSFDRYVWMPMYGGNENTSPGGVVLADTLPPFDITVSAINEYGNMSRLVIRGARIVDEGGVMGVDEMYIEQTHTFVALDVVPWIPGRPVETAYNPDYPETG
jgi:hypothetical protein